MTVDPEPFYQDPSPNGAGDPAQSKARSATSCVAVPDISRADAERWIGCEPEPLEFAIEGLVPKRMVTLHVADGGAGKSLLVQEGMTAVASAKPFLDLPTSSGSAAGMFAEDEDNVLHLRQNRINDTFSITMNDLAGKHFAQSYCGLDTVLWKEGATTELFSTIERQLGKIPDLQFLAIDTAAQVYAGNENDRMEVTQFIAALTGLAMRLDIGLMLTFHTSKTSDGSVARAGSGSTAWIWACRSVLKLDRGEEENEAVLTLLKANHTKPGLTIPLLWQDAVLIKKPDPTSSDQRMRKRRLDKLVFEQVRQAWDADWPLSPNPQAGERYLPKAIARLSEFSAKDAKDAMLTHMTAGNLKVDRKSARKPTGLNVEKDPFEGCV